MSPIPDGYELLVGRNRENAIKAISDAEDRGFTADSVLTQRDGYLVPLDPDSIVRAEEVEIPGKNASKAEIEEFATTWGIDLGDAKNNEQRLEAINAEIEKRTAAAESGELTGPETPATEPASADEAPESKED